MAQPRFFQHPTDEGADTLSSRIILWLTGFANGTAAVSRKEKEESEPMTYLNPAKLSSLINAEDALFRMDSNSGDMTTLSDVDMTNTALTTEILSG